MVDSNARLVEPAPRGGETGSVDQAVPFRFTVTWASVFDTSDTSDAAPLEPTSDRVHEVQHAPTQALLEPPAGPSKGSTMGDDRVLEGPKRSPQNPGVQWEMVVPKMVRAVPKATRTSEIGTLSHHSGPVLHQRPEYPRNSSPEGPRAEPTVVAPNLAADQPIPNFCSSPPRLSRARQISLGTKWVLMGAALVGLAVPLWRHFGTPAAAAGIQTTTHGGGWTREPVTRMDAGFNRARELVVYRPSLKATDCRFEFDWKADTAGVGWVFRAKDTANYYAMRVKVLKPGPSPTISVEHFTVYRGTEGAHSEKVLVLSRNDPFLRIRTELAGPSFTLYIGGTAAEYWTDTKLTTGGLGFFEEWHQGSDIQGVTMSFVPGTEIQRDGLRLSTNVPSGGD
jgi:hypothetical protein